jgi:cytochrome c553
MCLLQSGAAAAQGVSPTNAPEELTALLALKGDPAAGKKVFAACDVCHRKDASGRATGVFPRLAGQHASVIIKQISDIRAGRRNNPSMQPMLAEPTLNRTNIADVAAYLQSLPIGRNNGKGPGEAAARGKQLYEQDCLSCHGAQGQGEAAKFYPMVAAQHYLYLLREVVAIRDGDRRNSDPAMVRVVRNYAQGDIEAVADYMSRLPPPPGSATTSD